MYIEGLVWHFIYKLRLFICTMEEGLGFLGTMVFASPLVLGTPRPSDNGRVVGLQSPPLLAREWIHEATGYLVELVKERIESYGTTFF